MRNCHNYTIKKACLTKKILIFVSVSVLEISFRLLAEDSNFHYVLLLLLKI